MLGIRAGRDRLRVDVYDRSSWPPVLTNAAAGHEAGRGLVLVAKLCADLRPVRLAGNRHRQRGRAAAAHTVGRTRVYVAPPRPSVPSSKRGQG
jgi:hypothetical protein